MNGLKKTMAWLLVALWVPVTSHCSLEAVLDLEVLACCSHEADTPSAPHHEDDCETDACAILETGLYKTEDFQPSVTAVTQGLPILTPALPGPRLVVSSATLNLTTAPPELPRVWHFMLRAAPSPRAPSLTS